MSIIDFLILDMIQLLSDTKITLSQGVQQIFKKVFGFRIILVKMDLTKRCMNRLYVLFCYVLSRKVVCLVAF